MIHNGIRYVTKQLESTSTIETDSISNDSLSTIPEDPILIPNIDEERNDSF